MPNAPDRFRSELEAVEGSPDEAEVVHVPNKHRYELRLDGRLVGLAEYHRSDGVIVLTHTEVGESCRGRGFGSVLARAALEDARSEGLEVAPLCPFIERYIEQHPEYGELVASS